MPQEFSRHLKDRREIELFNAHFAKCIRDFNADDGQKLHMQLVKWRTMLGIKTEMSDTDATINAMFIRDEYSHLTIEQIAIAINMSLSGKLKVDPSLFNSEFTPLYIAKILNAFDKYNNDFITKLMKMVKDMETNKASHDNRTYEQKVADIRMTVSDYMQKVASSDTYEIDFKSITFHLIQKLGHRVSSETMAKYKELAEKDAERLLNPVGFKKKQDAEDNQFIRSMRSQKGELIKKYGRYYYNRDFIRSLDDIIKWIGSLEDEIIFPRPKQIGQ